MVRPIISGLRPNHHPRNNCWLFSIALPLLSSNSAHGARMLLRWKIFVPSIASCVARRPEAPKGFCIWSDTACTPARLVGWLKLAGSSSGFGAFCTTKPKFLAVLERIYHRGDAEHAETENAETTDFTDGLQWTRAFAVPQGWRCAPFI